IFYKTVSLGTKGKELHKAKIGEVYKKIPKVRASFLKYEASQGGEGGTDRVYFTVKPKYVPEVMDFIVKNIVQAGLAVQAKMQGVEKSAERTDTIVIYTSQREEVLN